MTSFVVPHAPLSAASVRHELVIDLTSRDVPRPVVDDAALVLSELVGNAVRHGSPLPDGGVRVSWELDGRALHLEVCDGGHGVDLTAAQACPAAEGGRGLAIVDLLAIRWGTTSFGDGAIGVYADLDVVRPPGC